MAFIKDQQFIIGVVIKLWFNILVVALMFIRQKTYSTVLHVLNSTFADRKYPDILIGGLFKKDDLSSSEKAAVNELVYGILRHMARLDYIIEHSSSAVIPGLDPNVLNILRICTYRAVFSDASPSGIMNNAVAQQYFPIKKDLRSNISHLTIRIRSG